MLFFKGGKSGETALHIASRIDEVRGEKCTRMLLKSGADPNMAMSNGRTALHVASENGTIANIKFLLQNGADVMLVDGEGETALHKAAKTCQQPSVKVSFDFVLCDKSLRCTEKKPSSKSFGRKKNPFLNRNRKAPG